MNKGLILSIISGLSTLSGLLFIKRVDNKEKINKIVNISLILSFIVLIYVSIFDLFLESLKILHFKPFLSIFLYFMINYIIIYLFLKISHKISKNKMEKGELYFLGIISAITLFLHNIPEGIITCITSSYNLKLGIKITLGIIMHNIPEGIMIAVPIYYSSFNKKRAVIYTFIASIGEIIGGILSFILIKYNLINYNVIGYIMISISSLMIIIAIEEIFPKIKFNNFKYIFTGLIFSLVFIIINIFI